MEQSGDGVLDEPNKRVVRGAHRKTAFGRVRGYSEVTIWLSMASFDRRGFRGKVLVSCRPYWAKIGLLKDDEDLRTYPQIENETERRSPDRLYWRRPRRVTLLIYR